MKGNLEIQFLGRLGRTRVWSRHGEEIKSRVMGGRVRSALLV